MSKWISIDLGTSNSSAAFWNGRHAEMIEFHDSRYPSGVSHQMPSAIAVDPESGDVFVGVEALMKGREHKGEWFYRHFKRRLGEEYHDAAESGHQTRADPKTGLVAYKGPNDDIIPTVDLACYQIEEILNQAAVQLGERPTHAVITIPADSGEAQKAATLEAARKAGLLRVELEHEPTMAALAFGYDFNKRRVIAVVDHGAGTLDVSFIETGKGRNGVSLVDVLVTDGRRKGLGGMDFDRATGRYLVNRFRTMNQTPDEWPETAAMTRITDAAEKAKQDLSGKDETPVFLLNIWRNPEGVDISMEETLDLKTFAEINSEMSRQIEAICRRAAEKVKEKDPKFLLSDVQDVILVGGMTRSPVVRNAVRAVFNKEPRREINPEEAVALGGAIKTAIFSGAISGVTVRDIITRAIGVETTEGIVSNIFPSGTSYPATREVTIRNADDDQAALSVAVLEGEGIYETECAILATHDHIVSEPGPAKSVPLKMVFKLDEGGRLLVDSADGWTWRGAA
jgi:molecular chaperone DnaK